MTTLQLANGVDMPIIGFGVYQIPDPEQCEEAVYQAICAGYRMIDTAAAYGNEESVGRAIQRCGVPRSELFISTKLWVQDTGFTQTTAAYERSLKRLQLDYLDLYLIHQPYSDVHGSWKAMQNMYKAGDVRAIGVSNFSPPRLTDLAAFNEITPMVNQVEVNPYHQQSAHVEFCEALGVKTVAWAPFAEGRKELFSHPILSGIALQHGKSVAQVVLRWLLQRGIAAIPKSVTPERIRENIDIFTFSLSETEMEVISRLDTRTSCFTDHDDPERIRWISTVKYNT